MVVADIITGIVPSLNKESRGSRKRQRGFRNLGSSTDPISTILYQGLRGSIAKLKNTPTHAGPDSPLPIPPAAAPSQAYAKRLASDTTFPRARLSLADSPPPPPAARYAKKLACDTTFPGSFLSNLATSAYFAPAIGALLFSRAGPWE